jgi:hypothetical protein
MRSNPIYRAYQAELEAVKPILRANARYLAAAQAMGRRQEEMRSRTDEYGAGWRACLREFCELVIHADTLEP